MLCLFGDSKLIFGRADPAVWSTVRGRCYVPWPQKRHKPSQFDETNAPRCAANQATTVSLASCICMTCFVQPEPHLARCAVPRPNAGPNARINDHPSIRHPPRSRAGHLEYLTASRVSLLCVSASFPCSWAVTCARGHHRRLASPASRRPCPSASSWPAGCPCPASRRRLHPASS